MSAPAYRLVLPRGADIAAMAALPPLPPFAPAALDFVHALSGALLRDPAMRAFPELMAFGHWIRRQQVLALKARFEADGAFRLGRGLLFHVAPGNVDTIFLYSFILALLAGNAAIVRLSERETDQVRAVTDRLARLLDDPAHEPIARRLALVRYGHDAAATRYFSAMCDLRVIWGGDGAVSAIRQAPLPPHARDLTFPDRQSLAVIDGAAWLAAPDKEDLVRRFANDAYWFAQMACSSPRAVLWLGPEGARASADFWPRLESRLADAPPELAPADFVNKLVAEQSVAVGRRAHIRAGADNRLRVIRLDRADALPLDLHCGGGLFYEAMPDGLDSVAGLAGRKLQTIVSHGIDGGAWRAAIAAAAPRGIDRVVPLGEALSFAPVWDGYDLLREFTREVTVQV